MHISFSPIRAMAEQPLTVSRKGDALTINGERFDFGPLPEGATMPLDAIGSPHFAGDVSRINGALHIPLLWPYTQTGSGHAETPPPVVMSSDGPVPVPHNVIEFEPPELTEPAEQEDAE